MVKINDIITETASAGSTSAGSVASVPANKPKKVNKNKDGTVKNALDVNSNIFGGKMLKR